MNDYISREAVLKAFKLVAKNPNKDYQRGMQDTIDCLVPEVIADIPSADVQPVKHGRWLNHHAIWIDQPKIEGWFVQAKCSECEKWAHVMNPYTKSVDYECCPHCGARMDGGAENDNNG